MAFRREKGRFLAMSYDFKDVKKILVIKLRHIGDVLLTVPVFRALRENFPYAHISALVNSGTEDVLRGNPMIDEIIVFERDIKKKNPIRRYLMELSFLRQIRARGFDMTVDLTSGDRAAIVSFFSGARYRLAYDPEGDGFLGKRHSYTHLAKKDGSQHIVLQNLAVIKQFGISTENLAVDIFIPDKDRVFVKEVFNEHGIAESDKVVHVHPTSRWLFKCWKDEYMAEVIGWLIEQGVKVVVTSAPDKKEMNKAKRILSFVSDAFGDSPDSTASPVNLGQSLLDLCGKTTIKQLAAISEASDLFLGIDSAPMHIATAVGTPVIALFGPTEAQIWGPWGNHHIAITKPMPCKPCQKGVCDGVELRRCLELITKEEVIGALSSALGLESHKD